MHDTVFLPGARDARGTLDAAATDTTPGVDADTHSVADAADADRGACVVACPPHPQHGGDRADPRLRGVSDQLTARGVDCLRLDYGAWDGGRGERDDALRATEWADQRYDRVGLSGYSFGGAVAISAAAAATPVVAVAALAPPARVGVAGFGDGAADSAGGIDAATDLTALRDAVAVAVLYGTRDDVVDASPVVEAARERGATVEAFPAGHRLLGVESEVAGAVAKALAPALQPAPRR